MRKGVGIKLWTFVFIGIFVGVSGYTFHYAKGTSYLSNDPKACTNCHIMQERFDSWQKSSHHAVVNCMGCHLPHETIPKWFAKLRNGFSHSKAFTFGNFHEPIRIKPKNKEILENNCFSCYASVVSGIKSYHSVTANALNCLMCHIQVGHGP